jgi:2-polyprenyl-3-methyl-5-hydroxy-6-metoxy-1,4-benzoquinol methylase
MNSKAAVDPSSHWFECPSCGSSERTTWIGFEELEFVRCLTCSLVYKSREHPNLNRDDLYEASYFTGRRSGRDRRFEHRVRKAARWIRAALQFTPARSLLDVGCSLGYVIEGGQRLGLRSAGVDVSKYAVEVCQQRGYSAKVGTLEALPFEESTFDILVMKHVLEHSHVPKAVLGEVARVLTPGGVVLVAVPDVTYWKGTVFPRTYRYFRPDDLGQQHHVYFSMATLTRLLETSGFTVLATSKGFFRTVQAGRSPLHWLYEWARHLTLTPLFALTASLRLRRELFVIARRA